MLGTRCLYTFAVTFEAATFEEVAVGQLTGKQGRDDNLYGEVLLITLCARAHVSRGRQLTLEELAEALDAIAVIWDVAAADDDVVHAGVRLARIIGDKAWVRQVVPAWRRQALAGAQDGDVRRIGAGELRRLGTLSKYRRWVQPAVAAYIRSLVRRQARVDALSALAESAPDVAAELAVRWQTGVPAPPPPPPPPPPAPARPRWCGRWQRLQHTGCARTGDWPSSPARYTGTLAPAGDGDGGAAGATDVGGGDVGARGVAAEGCRRRGWGWP
jgi:hypothetical protein